MTRLVHDYVNRFSFIWVSSPGESHPQALAEPDVNLSAHPAPIIHRHW
jgi:hypothetical protein